MKKNIGILVVTYNRPKDLNICLKSIENQSYKPKVVCIVDNASSDETLNLLEKKGILNSFDIENIKRENFNFSLEDMSCYLKTTKLNNLNYIYLRLKENTGGSGGFYYGLKYLHEYTDLEGYYILDDDGVLDENCLKEIIPYTNDYLSITSLKLDRDNPNNLIPHVGYCVDDDYKYFPVRTLNRIENNIEISFSSFVGWYFARELISKIGYPKKDFFIRSDDTEFSFRLKKKNISTLLICKSKIYHPSGIEKRLPLFKYFFDFRNLSYIFSNYFKDTIEMKTNIIELAHQIFYKFLKIKFDFFYSYEYFKKLMYDKNNNDILKFLKNFKFDTNLKLSSEFIVFSSNSYLNIIELYKHPLFKGAVYFEKGNKIFNISFDNIIKILRDNKGLKILLEGKGIFIYKLLGYLIRNNAKDLIDRIIL